MRRRQSIVSDWDLICRDAWKAQATNSGFFLGFLIGAALFGFLADRCGAPSFPHSSYSRSLRSRRCQAHEPPLEHVAHVSLCGAPSATATYHTCVRLRTHHWG